MTSIAPVPDLETPARNEERCSDFRHGWGSPIAHARWGGIPLCGIHLNGERRRYHNHVEREKRWREEDAAQRAAMFAAETLANLGIDSEVIDGRVSLSPETVESDLIPRLVLLRECKCGA